MRQSFEGRFAATSGRGLLNDPKTMDQWFDYVYLRDNPKGRFDEYVHHSGGCRAWLVITRDTQTHEVFGVVTVRDYAKKRAKA